MAIFNPAALGVSKGGGGKKEDTKAQGAFDPLALSTDQQDINAQVDQVRKSTAQAVLLKQQELELFASGEGFNKFSRWANKIYGSPEAAKLKVASDVAGQIADIRRQGALTIQSLLQPGASELGRMEKILQENQDSATMNRVMDSTERFLTENPNQGRVIPFMAEAFRAGVEGVGFKDVIADPFVDPFYQDPAALNIFEDWMNDLGILSVNADGTINDSVLGFVENLKNIPGISQNASKGAMDLFLASQARALSIQKKEDDEDAAEAGVLGTDFAITDAGVEHRQAGGKHWRTAAEEGFDKFRIFVALQEMGIVLRTTEFEKDFDFMGSLLILRQSGGSLADMKENAPLWAKSTARALDQFSGPDHTPHLFHRVEAENPDLAQNILTSPELRKLISINYLPSLQSTDEQVNRNDLRNKASDLSDFLKELDERTGAE